MRYPEYENILSVARLNRYLIACNGQTKKAMTLYRFNLRLSQALFTTIGNFEISLRNSIDNKLTAILGNNWLIESVASGGIISNERCRLTEIRLNEALTKLGSRYSHNKLVAELSFGFWRYLFASHQFNATGRTLLSIFPARPHSSAMMHFNRRFIFNQLAQINNLRNRIAHHEPVCFVLGHPIKSCAYARENYEIISRLFEWMSIDKSSFLYGLDHILDICSKIERL